VAELVEKQFGDCLYVAPSINMSNRSVLALLPLDSNNLLLLLLSHFNRYVRWLCILEVLYWP